MQTYFITGTDTDCGKTTVTCQLLNYLNQRNKKALALKPVVTGSVKTGKEWYAADVLAIKACNIYPDYPICNWHFKAPVSPHIASAYEGKRLNSQDIYDFCLKAKTSLELDFLFIEGAGGLQVPLNAQETWLDFLNLSKIPVIFVVGMQLGCLNHALLSDFILREYGISCLGWISNHLDPKMLALEDNILTLIEKMQMPYLTHLPFQGILQEDKRLNTAFLLNACKEGLGVSL